MTLLASLSSTGFLVKVSQPPITSAGRRDSSATEEPCAVDPFSTEEPPLHLVVGSTKVRQFALMVAELLLELVDHRPGFLLKLAHCVAAFEFVGVTQLPCLLLQ